VLLFGCSYLNPVEYTYKNDQRHPLVTKSEIRKNPIVGIAILNKDGAQSAYYVERGIYDYINYKSKENFISELDSHDIGSEIDLDENRIITNGYIISEKYPGMRYVLYMWRNPPHVVKKERLAPRTTTSNGKEDIVWDTVYETSISIDTETVLFDLIDNVALARAVKTFKHTDSNIDKYEEPSNNFLLWFLDTFSNFISTPSDKFPSVNFYSLNREIEDYVYYFLENINKT